LEIKFSQRETQDQFYWYINDLVKVADKYHYGIPGVHNYGGPATYEAVQDDPRWNLKQWVDYVDRYIKVRQLEKDWREYYRSSDPNKTLEKVSDPQHCYDNILRDNTGFYTNKTMKSAFALSDTLREVLPKLRPKPTNRSQFPEWISYDAAAQILTVEKDYLRKLARGGKIIRHPKGRRLIDRDSVFDYRDGK